MNGSTPVLLLRRSCGAKPAAAVATICTLVPGLTGEPFETFLPFTLKYPVPWYAPSLPYVLTAKTRGYCARTVPQFFFLRPLRK